MRIVLDSDTGRIDLLDLKPTETAQVMEIMNAVRTNPLIPDHITVTAQNIFDLIVSVWETILVINPPNLSGNVDGEVQNEEGN